MYLFLLIFCTCGNIVKSGDSSDSGDEGKFIDLLPEDEKKAFLESVARRLVSGIKTRDAKYKSDEEISEESLNKHGGYVQKTLKEESDNLRRNGKLSNDSAVKIDDKNDKPIKIQDDEDKEHVDLTLRQGNRRKRNEKSGEFVPVPIVYDDENDRVIKKERESDKIVDDDVNTNSKERSDENSTKEDIQVRGSRHHSRDSRQATTKRPFLRYESATKIESFDPEDSSEELTTKKVETSTDKYGKNGFTHPIYDPIGSGSEGVISSNESVEVDFETSSTTETTTKLVTYSTVHTVVDTETTPTVLVVETTTPTEIIIVENTTADKPILRDDSNDLEQDMKKEHLSNESRKMNYSSNETEDATAEINVTTYRVDTTLDDYVTNNNKQDFDSDNSVTTSRTENLNDSSGEHLQSSKNNSRDVSSEENFTHTTKSVDTTTNSPTGDDTTTISPISGEVQKNIKLQRSSAELNEKVIPSMSKTNTTLPDITETMSTPQTSDELTNKQNAAEVENNDLVENKTTENYFKQGTEVTENVEELSEPHEFTDKNSVLGNFKQSSEVNTEKLNEQDNDTQNITKVVNESLSNDLRSSPSGNETKNISRSQEHATLTDMKKADNNIYIEFEDISAYKGNVLTTTERNTDPAAPNYSISYTKLVNQSENYKGNCDKKSNKTENNDKQDIDENNEKHSANLEKNAKVLRQGMLLEDDDQSKEERSQKSRTSSKAEEYIVFEVPADAEPFVTTKPKYKQEDQPFYVPVYNYAPSNAYYSAYNRLGPNNDDDNNDVFENMYERDSAEFLEPKVVDFYRNVDGHRKFKFTNKRPKSNLKAVPRPNNFIRLPFVIKTPKLTEVYFQPDEYLDMDYYLERAHDENKIRDTRKKRKRSKFKGMSDSVEMDEPYYAMSRNNVKSHINYVRQLMYHNKYFGYVPDITSPATVTTASTKAPTNDYDNDYFLRSHKSQGLNSKTDDNKKNFIDPREITLDYYFGTQNSEENNRNSIRYDYSRKHKLPKIKNMNGKNSTVLLNLIRNIRSINNNRRKMKKPQPDKNERKRNELIKDVIQIGPVEDAFMNIEKLKKVHLKAARRRDTLRRTEEVKVYVNVLRDMLQMNNRALERFDWLGSTVDILGAVKKLKYLAKNQHDPIAVHPADLELLNYLLYLYKITKHAEDRDNLRIPIKSRLPRPKSKKIKKRGYFTTAFFKWLVRNGNDSLDENFSDESADSDDFLDFLDDLETSLYDLHKALKYIAMVTKYKDQHWLSNLKSLYLRNSGEKELLELLLHIFTTRLIQHIEKSAEDGLEDGYLEYMEQNEREVERTKEELAFVLKLVEEIKNSEYNEEGQ